jgi:DNA polymerase-3 subunit beta
MKIECSKEKILDAIRKVEKVAVKHQTLPVLSCILLVAGKNVLTLRSTNLDVGVEIKIAVKTDVEGVVAVPAQVFSSCVSGIDDEKITIELIENNLIISSDNANFKVKTQPHDDFPIIPMVSEDTSFVLESKDIVKGLKSVLYASATSTMKPELSSVYIHSDGAYIHFVATDSFRLAEKKIALKKKSMIPSVLIPFRNAGEIVRVFENISDEVECHTSKNQISLISDGVHLTSRVVDGNFPDYKQIIPKEFTTEVIVLKEDFNKALRLATVFADKFNQVRIIVDKKAKKFEITSKNADTGEGKNILTATIEGDGVDIGFNHRYIADCLQSIDVESLHIGFSGEQRPMVIKGASDQSFTYIVMPMNR